MNKVLLMLEDCKQRIAEKSALEIRGHNRRSIAHLSICGPSLTAFIECASNHKLIPPEVADFIYDAVQTTDPSMLAARITAVKVALDLAQHAVVSERPDARQATVEFLAKVWETPTLLSASPAEVERLFEPVIREHRHRRGISRAEAPNGTLAKKVHALPRSLPGLRRRREPPRRQ